MQPKNTKSTHIISSSSTLLGLCFVVYSSLSALKLTKDTLLDEFSAVCMFLFLISCIFSFLSIRTTSTKWELYEKVADYSFMAGLLSLFMTTVLLTFNLVK